MTSGAGKGDAARYDYRLGSAVTAYFSLVDGALSARARGADGALLDGDERARHASYRREEDRDLYVRAHALVRRALSRAEPSVAPEQWRFAREGHERPALEPSQFEATGLRFNLTHTPGLVACALSRAAPEVGIDAEDTARAVSVDSVSRVVYDARELAMLAAMGPAAKRARFYDLWTLKEAWLKARGFGMSCDPQHLGFDFDAPDGLPRVRFDRAHLAREVPGPWAFWLHSPTRAHRLALAVRSETPAVECGLYEYTAEGAFEPRASLALPTQRALLGRAVPARSGGGGAP